MARRRGNAYAAVLICLAVACAAPLLLLTAALLTRTGVISPELGYDGLARRVAFGLAFPGVAAGLAAVWLSARKRVGRRFAVVSLVIALATVGGFFWQTPRVVAGPVEDVSTDLTDLPGFGVLAEGRGTTGPTRTVGVEACPGALPAMTQSLPEAVVYELQRLGFGVRRAGVTGVYATRRGFWFGFTEDVVVRIRPGRTDIRIAARDARPHGGQACRAVTQLSQALKVGER